MAKDGTIDEELTRENTISIEGFIWNTEGLPHPDSIEGIGKSGWRSGMVKVKISDLEKMGFIRKPEEPAHSFFLESIDSEIMEDSYEEGEGSYTGCGLPMTPLAEKFRSKEEMLKWVEDNYGFTDFEENESPGIMATTKTVANHSSEQNGGWMEPTEKEVELWKLGRGKLYAENVTIRYHKT